MSWVRGPLVVGAVLLALGFAVGTEAPTTRYRGESYSCGSVLRFAYDGIAAPAPDPTPGQPSEATLREQCRPTHAVQVIITWGGIGFGALGVLIGWTVLREREVESGAQN